MIFLKLEEKFLGFIKKNNLLAGAEKVLLGVSGGPDSLAMLDLFFKYRNYFGIKIAAVHLDHLFRDESASEADFVEKKAAELEIDFYRKKVDVPKISAEEKLSPEAAARQERFKFFREIYFKENFDLLALAHHRDDQVETVLLNIFRGAGLRGLSGIEKRLSINGVEIIHPLLNLNKEEILNYCRENELEPRIDKSNQQNIYIRNIIRNKILPIIEQEINPSVREVIARNAELIGEEENYLNLKAQEKFEKALIEMDEQSLSLDLEKLQKMHQVIRRRVLRTAFESVNQSMDDFYLEHILELEKLLEDSATGRGIDLPAETRAEISYGKLLFLKGESIENILIEDKLELSLNEKHFFETAFSISAEIADKEDITLNADPNRAVVDYKKVNLPIYIRYREAGDSFIPLGMQGRKKLKDFLIDEKVPRFKRDKILLLVDAENNIIWVAGYRIAEDYKVEDTTDKVLVFRYEDLN